VSSADGPSGNGGVWRDAASDTTCARPTRSGLTVTVVSSENSGSRSEVSGRLSIHDVGDGALRLLGEIDMDTAPTLRRRLEGDAVVTVLDLDDVTFIDSIGVSVLVWANRDRAAGPLTLRSPSDAVLRMLELAGMSDLFRIDARQPSAD
jgi:anti-anti-sigma factor